MNATVTSTLTDAPVFEHFTVTPVTPRIGGLVEGIHLSELNEESAAELRQALWHYGVLFARKQNLTPEQQKKVAYFFGEELEHHSFGKTLAEQGHPEVLLIEMYKSDKAKTSTDIWHHDVTARKHPNIMSILQADEVPFGADTMWSSASAAYDSLPYAMKLMFLNLDIDHDTAYMVLRHDFGDATTAAEKMIKLGESNTHPAVVNHPFTGRLCLLMGNGYVKRVHGYNAEMSELILKVANDLIKTPEFQVRYQWGPGDVAIWDNFGTTHYGVTADLGDRVRRLHRVAAWSKNVTPTLDREKAIRELMQSRA
jgi:alpha-ketoglutarate-dependent taurine dioxygenase